MKTHNSGRKGTLILLTSGTTGTPRGPGADPAMVRVLVAIPSGVPWRVGETTVVAAPMFHAWGFFQLVFSAMMACTIDPPEVRSRGHPPEPIDRYRATGLGVAGHDRADHGPARRCPASLLTADRRASAAASGLRMRGDVVTAFMDEFGEIVYNNNYNATETGWSRSPKPEDLRAAPRYRRKTSGRHRDSDIGRPLS